MKKTKIECTYQIGEIYYPTNHAHVNKYEIVAIRPTYDFKGPYGTPEREEIENSRIFLARLDGSMTPVYDFQQNSEESKHWTKDYREAYKIMVENNLLEAQRDYNYTMREIVSKKD